MWGLLLLARQQPSLLWVFSFLYWSHFSEKQVPGLRVKGGSLGPSCWEEQQKEGGQSRGGRCPPASQPPEIHLSVPSQVSPLDALPVAGAAPALPHVPPSSGFFLCNLFFKKSLYYFFIRLQQQLPGAWDFIFLVGGGGDAISSPCLS